MQIIYQLSGSFIDLWNKKVDYFPYLRVHSTEEIAWNHQEQFIQWLKENYRAKSNIEIFCDELILEE